MEPSPAPISWTDILKVALSTGIVAALINQGITWLRDWRKESSTIQRNATYLALRVAVILEQFAIMCADVIGDNVLYRDSDGHAGKSHGSLPPLGEYPTDADWKSVDPAFSARALALRNEIFLSDGAIAFVWEVDHDTVQGACNEHAGKCGYRAWQLAVDLRKRYGLPEFDPKQTHWDIVPVLKESFDAAEKKRVTADEPCGEHGFGSDQAAKPPGIG
jgi:hypothetical protein